MGFQFRKSDQSKSPVPRRDGPTNLLGWATKKWPVSSPDVCMVVLRNNNMILVMREHFDDLTKR
jgi:hypothetical protein